MTRRHSGMLLIVALVAAMPALTRAAPDSAAAQAEPTRSVAAEAGGELRAEDKTICKKVKTTGSHFKRRVCQKQSVWRAQREASQEEHRRMLSRPSTNAPG